MTWSRIIDTLLYKSTMVQTQGAYRLIKPRCMNSLAPGHGPCGCNHWLVNFQTHINTLRPRQNGRHFADDTFNRLFVNENVRISIKFSLKFVPKGPINNIPALVQIMAWRRPGDKPLSDPVMVSLLTHICVTRPQWVKDRYLEYFLYNWALEKKSPLMISQQ